MSRLDKVNFQPIDGRPLSAERQHVVEQMMIRETHAARAKLARAMVRHLSRALRRALIRLATELVLRWRAYTERRERLRAMAQLQGFSDYDLQDIGVSRSEIPWVVDHGRYEPPVRASETARSAVVAVPVKAQRRAA